MPGLALAERDCGVRQHRSDGACRASIEAARTADVIVTMGCGDTCPYYPGKRYLDWELEDPAGKPVEMVRPIVAEIDRRVQALLSELIDGSP